MPHYNGINNTPGSGWNLRRYIRSRQNVHDFLEGRAPAPAPASDTPRRRDTMVNLAGTIETGGSAHDALMSAFTAYQNDQIIADGEERNIQQTDRHVDMSAFKALNKNKTLDLDSKSKN